MLVNDAPVLDPRRVAQIEHGSVKPPISGLAEPHPGIRCHGLAAGAAARKVGAEPASGQDSALDGPPPQPTALVLEDNLQDPGRTDGGRSRARHAPAAANQP